MLKLTPAMLTNANALSREANVTAIQNVFVKIY